VEDELVNQELALHMLQNLGCRPEVASNGEEALKRARGERFDLILMDCQMPVMDGYEATGAIRELERAGMPKVPIVALTAHALEGDWEKCLAAGMDDYLSKPLTQAELAKKLERWLERQAYPAKAEASSQESERLTERTASIDTRALDAIRSQQRKGKPDLLPQVIALFLEDSPGLVQDLEEAAAAEDSARAERISHRLKSGSANVGASRLASLCEEAELAARSEELERVRELAGRIRAECGQVRTELGAVVEGSR
jgi:CheY-like chemotaxis protein/HPt (histidine-containing phosphotransfer) domain-containing protein